MNTPKFPLDGVIGIVANNANEIQKARQHELQCVEMRPDLLLDRGFALDEVMTMVKEIANCGLGCLFTMRRHDHGGKFTGSDREQMQLCLQAVEAGAHVVDVEWDSACGGELISRGVKTILSYHDFNGMPSATELASITNRITALKPIAIKIVPTATAFNDAIQILQWVSEAGSGPRRIGFAMGTGGEFSRILTRTYGSPITYASFDAAVAPGQIPIDQLLSRYHADSINEQTHVIGVTAEQDESDQWLTALNKSTQALQNQWVAVPLKFSEFESVQASAAFLRMDFLILSASKSASIPASMCNGGALSGTSLIDFRQSSVSALPCSSEAEIEDCMSLLDHHYP